ncbi:MAG: GH3 auxin-responsive promoter family protein, partial [Bacteroidales bacterium]
MPVIPRLIKRLNAKRISQIENFMRHPVDTQQNVLSDLLRRAADTEWGSKYKYASIKSGAEYRSAVPVQTYEKIIPIIERLRAGEKDILWPGEIKWFAKSSGTTSSKSKFIPVSLDSLEHCHYQAARDILA